MVIFYEKTRAWFESSSRLQTKGNTLIHRRAFLKGSVAMAVSSPAFACHNERVLRLYNTHTGESVRSVFWADGDFIPDALHDLNRILRDHRNDKIVPIDTQLLVLLEQVSDKFGKHPLHIISGYRSPETNRMLAEQSGGVAKHSMHLDGKAIDIRIPGCDLGRVHKAALSLQGGGVGFYPGSQFVHMDTGRLRNW